MYLSETVLSIALVVLAIVASRLWSHINLLEKRLLYAERKIGIHWIDELRMMGLKDIWGRTGASLYLRGSILDRLDQSPAVLPWHKCAPSTPEDMDLTPEQWLEAQHLQGFQWEKNYRKPKGVKKSS